MPSRQKKKATGTTVVREVEEEEEDLEPGDEIGEIRRGMDPAARDYFLHGGYRMQRAALDHAIMMRDMPRPRPPTQAELAERAAAAEKNKIKERNRIRREMAMFLPKKAYRAGAYVLSPSIEGYGLVRDYVSPRLSPAWNKVRNLAGRYVPAKLQGAISPVWDGIGSVGGSIAGGARAVHNYMTDGVPVRGPFHGVRDWVRGDRQPF